MHVIELAEALGVVVLLVLISRWVFTPSTPRRGLRPVVGGDRGLLRAVAEVPDRAGAADLQARLRAAGIRSTSGPTAAGAIEVLVFEHDLDRARQVLPGDGV